MKTYERKINDLDTIKAYIQEVCDGGFKVCKRTENPSFKIVYTETRYGRRQKTAYFKGREA